ncbi:MAG: enoyl-CoA hydratase/isomerase family protein [Phycisphaerales bacterium]|nr:MAG: enoyl-CoA hydratase/isomerase family protein [Phycisphaerales bacterium]
MSNTDVRVDIDGSQASITLVTEGGVNVASTAVLKKLREAIAKVASASGVRTTVVKAEGKVFLAGADIKEMAPFNREQATEYGKLGQSAFNELEALPSITVAAINGAAMGGGMELALACDFRIAVKSAKLALPETSLGLIPGWNGIKRLTALIGIAKAKKLYLTALPVSAEDGLAYGLVDEIVSEAGDLGPRVAAFCTSFKRAAPAAVAFAKKALCTGDDLSAFADCFETDDGREGMTAFIEKRPASWMEE